MIEIKIRKRKGCVKLYSDHSIEKVPTTWSIVFIDHDSTIPPVGFVIASDATMKGVSDLLRVVSKHIMRQLKDAKEASDR
jgi:hypothetical protein